MPDNIPTGSRYVLNDDHKTSTWTFVALYILTMVILFSTVFFSRDFVRYSDFNSVEHRVDILEAKIAEVSLLLKFSFPERQRVMQDSKHNLKIEEKEQLNHEHNK